MAKYETVNLPISQPLSTSTTWNPGKLTDTRDTRPSSQAIPLSQVASQSTRPTPSVITPQELENFKVSDLMQLVATDVDSDTDDNDDDDSDNDVVEIERPRAAAAAAAAAAAGGGAGARGAFFDPAATMSRSPFVQPTTGVSEAAANLNLERKRQMLQNTANQKLLILQNNQQVELDVVKQLYTQESAALHRKFQQRLQVMNQKHAQERQQLQQQIQQQIQQQLQLLR